MKTFKVTASYTTYLETYIEAEDLEQAEQLACELDGGAFDSVDSDGWNINDVYEVTQ